MSVYVPIDFDARFDKVSKAAATFAQDLSGKLGKIDLSTKFLAFDKIAQRVGQGLGLVADGIGSVITAASEMEQTNVRLAASLKASGDFSDKNVESFKNLADNLARTSKFDDDLILGQVALAKQFDTTNAEAAKLIAAAVDLSAVTGDDLPTSVAKLGQTLDGTLGSIGKNIPALKNLTEEQLRNGGAVEFIASKYKGFAESELNTFSGSVAQVEKAFGDLQKAIGSQIINSKALKEVFGSVVLLFQDATEYVNENKVAIQDFVRNGIIFLAKAVGFLAQVFAQLDILLNATYLGFQTIYEAVKNLVLYIKNYAVTAFSLIGNILSGNFTAAADDIKKFFADTAANATESIGKLNQTVDGLGSRQGVYDAISEKAAEFAFNVETGNKYITKTKAKIKEAKVEFDSLGASSKRVNLQLKSDFEALAKSLENQGADALTTLQKKFERESSLINAFRGKTFQSQKNADELLHKLRLKYIIEEAKIQQEKYDKLVSRVQAVVANPFASSAGEGQVPSLGGAFNLSPEASVGLSRGIGVAGNVLNGEEGARKLIGLAASAAGTALFGPAGQALGPLIEQLSQGPEKVKQMVEQFADAIPVLIENVIKALPVVIEVLADKLPEIIEKLTERAPEIIEALIQALPRVVAKMITLQPRLIAAWIRGAIQFGARILSGATGFVGKILSGAGKFVEKILQGAAQFVKKLAGGAAGGITNLIPGLGKGGGGLAGIGKIAIGSSGSPLGGLTGLLGGGGGGGFFGSHSGGLGVSVGGISFKGGGGGNFTPAKASGPQSIKVPVVINGKELATAIVDLQKLGYKVSPA